MAISNRTIDEPISLGGHFWKMDQTHEIKTFHQQHSSQATRLEENFDGNFWLRKSGRGIRMNDTPSYPSPTTTDFLCVHQILLTPLLLSEAQFWQNCANQIPKPLAFTAVNTTSKTGKVTKWNYCYHRDGAHWRIHKRDNQDWSNYTKLCGQWLYYCSQEDIDEKCFTKEWSCLALVEIVRSKIINKSRLYALIQVLRVWKHVLKK